MNNHRTPSRHLSEAFRREYYRSRDVYLYAAREIEIALLTGDHVQLCTADRGQIRKMPMYQLLRPYIVTNFKSSPKYEAAIALSLLTGVIYV